MDTDDIDSGQAILDELKAKTDIEALILRYALCVRSARGSEAAELFTEDSFFAVHPQPSRVSEMTIARRIEGRSAIKLFLSDKGDIDWRIYPTIQNLLIDVEGDKARASSLMRSISVPSGLELLGEYEDELTFDGVWRFASRTFRVHWTRQP